MLPCMAMLRWWSICCSAQLKGVWDKGERPALLACVADRMSFMRLISRHSWLDVYAYKAHAGAATLP
jgi:hypothetical protein